MMFTKKNTPPKLQRTLDGIRKEKNNTYSIKEKKEISLSSFFSFLSKKRKLTSTFLLTILILGGVSFFFSKNIKGATYGWIQSSWIGGVTVNTATHTNNQENWTEYASKDSNIQADASGVTITGTNNSWVETSDADFNDGSFAQTYTTGNAIYTQKPFGATCTTNAQCSNGGDEGTTGGLCSGGICTDPWQTGPCAGIYVHAYNASGTYMWKTTQTNCDTPQCGLNGGQNDDNLVADNSVDFSLYPARNACKNMGEGGRLPTLLEFQCIYTNRAVYDDYGGLSTYHWLNTENSTTYAHYFDSTVARGGVYHKTNSYSVRCVRGQ
ncbi:MAG: hypothetical protein IPN70_03575 [Candidatus Moraniibacteriota bacterium]|nr:MAG: hypothetical protein IPN70_03575 [Candidatus Moranbacteria bacterium]